MGKVASNFLKAELAKRGITYDELKNRLALLGVEQSTSNIASKICRGRFMLTFFLQCMLAIGAERLDLTDYFSIFKAILPTNKAMLLIG